MRRLRLRRTWMGAAIASAVLATAGISGFLVRAVREPSALEKELEGLPLRRQLKAPSHFTWSLVDNRSYQIATNDTSHEATEATDAREQTGRGCPVGMVRARGNYKLDASGRASSTGVEDLQNTTCTSWISRDFPARCASFDPVKWRAASAKLATAPVDVCIDRFEYPNVAGAYPVIMVTYFEAQATCKASGKRLCTETEWTFACEGEEATPYPYGYDRNPAACVVDAPVRPVSEGLLTPRGTTAAHDEVDRLWQGEKSGARPACRSPFGVYDMTGNVDEWTRSVRDGERPSIMKGGYWGPVRARCRPSTRAHGEEFVDYQQGFRCCADAPKSAPDAGEGADAQERPAALDASAVEGDGGDLALRSDASVLVGHENEVDVLLDDDDDEAKANGEAAAAAALGRRNACGVGRVLGR